MMEVKVSRGRGRGVFAMKDIPRGQVFHKCPVVIVNDQTIGKEIERYVFGWTTHEVAVALGLGSLFNHSESPNAEYTTMPDEHFPEIHFEAKRKIKKGQEIFIDYGPLYVWDRNPK